MKYLRVLGVLLILLGTFFVNVNVTNAETEPGKVVLTDEESAYIRTLGTVKMCVDPDWYPYEKIDSNGLHQGIAADLIRLVAERAGLQIQLVVTKDWEESLSYSKAGKCDIVSLLNETPERKKWLLFTEPYFEDPNVLITRDEHEYISDISRLSDETVVLPEGTSIEERIRSDYPNVKVILVSSEQKAMEFVASRKADFTVRSLSMAAYTIRNQGLFNLKVAGQIPDYENQLRIGVSEDEPILCQILNKGIATLTPEDIQHAVNNHIPIKIQRGFDYRLFFIVFGLFSVVVLAGLVWNYQLRVLNRQLKAQKSELILIGERLAESEALYKSFLNASPDAVIIANLDGTIAMASPMAFELVKFDKEKETLIGRQTSDFIVQKQKEQMKLSIARLFNGEKIGTTEYEGIREDGQTFIMEVNSEVIPGMDGVTKQMVSIIRDVTQRRRMEEDLKNSEKSLRELAIELENQNALLSEKADNDKLTGIRNRHYLDQHIREAINLSERYGTPTTLLIFDLDKFKSVNDNYGHDIGDQVLIRISDCVQNIVQKTDVFARWGGEEFVVLMSHTGLEGAHLLAEKIRSAVEKIIHPNVGKVTISVGVAEHMKGESVEEWFKRADKELYRAKHEGRNCVCLSTCKVNSIHLDIEWESNWNCGCESIDEQHRVLLDLGNNYIQSALNNSNQQSVLANLDELIHHVAWHFETEERILAQLAYDDLENHSSSHKKLTNKAIGLREKVIANEVKSSDAFEFIVSDVIMKHLLEEDIEYFPLIKASMQNGYQSMEQ